VVIYFAISFIAYILPDYRNIIGLEIIHKSKSKEILDNKAIFERYIGQIESAVNGIREEMSLAEVKEYLENQQLKFDIMRYRDAESIKYVFNAVLKDTREKMSGMWVLRDLKMNHMRMAVEMVIPAIMVVTAIVTTGLAIFGVFEWTKTFGG